MPLPRLAITLAILSLLSAAVSAQTAPSIATYLPTYGLPGSTITINGSAFGASQGTSTVSLVSSSNVRNRLAVTRWTNTQIIAAVPSGTQSGSQYIEVTVGGISSVGTYVFAVGAAPSINSFSPASGTSGATTTLTINGSGFGAAQGSSILTLHSTSNTKTILSPTTWSDTQIIATIPANLANGPQYIHVTVGGLRTSSVNAFLEGTLPAAINSSGLAPLVSGPAITSYSPNYGPVGTSITIIGTGFGTGQGSSTLSLVSTSNVTTNLTGTTWTSTQIVAPVPAGMVNGLNYIYITVGGIKTTGTYPFTVGIPPSISTYTPQYGLPGTSITVTGSGFGSSQGSSLIYFVSTSNVWTYLTVTSWSPTQIVATVPGGTANGLQYMYVTVAGLGSIGTYVFTVGVPPSISTYSPKFGPPGISITVTGSGFGSNQGSSVIYFVSTSNVWTYLTVTNWTATQIVATVPAGTANGLQYMYVTVAGLRNIGTYPFTVGIPPAISSYSPNTGPAGTAVTVNGSGFGATQGSSVIYVLSTSNVWTYLTVTNWSATQIVAIIPAGTATGLQYIYANVGGLISIGTYPFTITPPTTPTITSLSTTAASAGTQVTINGSGFGPIQGTSSVLLGTTAGIVISWADVKVVATVAPSSQSGTVQILQLGALSNALSFTVTTPIITSVSPTSTTAGAQVTITGSGFGSVQGTGSVWLGSTLGTVVSWNAGQVMATVATGSASGSAQIQQGGVASNSIPFTVSTPVISAVSPTSGLPGTQVTLTGSGFGAAQGSGIVWLGNAPAVVSTWTGGQIVATVASGSNSGTAKILQNGVWSNSVAFTINLPHITGISPASGSSGTTVTITGSGFGTPQGGGVVWIGSTAASITSWSNTQVVATVASGALSGVVKVQQNSTWSNAVTFTVPAIGGTTAITLVPNVFNMPLGSTSLIQALNSTSQLVKGLAWASSNTSIAALSTDDPPIITAVGAGNATITAGNASADVTVFPGVALPTGTILWGNPGNGSGVLSIMPAVPSSTGVADVFAFQADGTVQAMTSSGTTAWTASVGTNKNLIPDFQGGLTVANYLSIYKLDGVTGQPYPSYIPPSGNYLSPPVVHADGTIFTVSGNFNSGESIVGINPQNGQAKFSVQINNSIFTSNSDSNNCPSYSSSESPWFGNLMIAGDGYAYVPFLYQETTTSVTGCLGLNTVYLQHLRLLRVGSAGDYSIIPLADWSSYVESYPTTYPSFKTYTTGTIPSILFETPITNADAGVTCSWLELGQSYWSYQASYPTVLEGQVASYFSFHLTTTSGSTVASQSLQSIPGQSGPLKPILQRADGSYLGTVDIGPFDGPVTQTDMIAFTPSGSPLWIVPNDAPQIATSDGGVIAASGTTYDQNGNADGQLSSLPILSWKGAYQLGSVDSVLPQLFTLAPSFAAYARGNFTGNGTSMVHHYIGLFWCGTGYAEMGSCSDVGAVDIPWKYIPKVQEQNFNNAVDFSVTHPEWVDTIQSAALDALKRAFSQFPVTVERAAQHGSFWPCLKNWELPGCITVQRVSVSGVWPGDGGTGETTGIVPLSFAYYWISLQNSQGDLNLNPPYPPQTDQDSNAFAQLLPAIGRGIANAATHEFGHQFAYTFVINMDCNKPYGTPCQADANGDTTDFEIEGGIPAEYKNVYPVIHWQPNSVCALQQYFVAGYRDKNCTFSYKK